MGNIPKSPNLNTCIIPKSPIFINIAFSKNGTAVSFVTKTAGFGDEKAARLVPESKEPVMLLQVVIPKYNRVGGEHSSEVFTSFRVHLSSHTTVQAVPHTAVPCFGARLVVLGYQLPNIAMLIHKLHQNLRQFVTFNTLKASNSKKSSTFALSNKKTGTSMPEISRFFGIIIAMFGDDHNPPHFHVRYGDYRCTITISKGVVKGQLPRKALKKVFEWMDEHHNELLANWARLQNGEEALPIDPLK